MIFGDKVASILREIDFNVLRDLPSHPDGMHFSWFLYHRTTGIAMHIPQTFCIQLPALLSLRNEEVSLQISAIPASYVKG